MTKKYFYNLLIGVDQLINTIFGGYPDETISSRMGKRIKKNDCLFSKAICRILDIFDKGHCEDAIEKDEGLPY